MDYKQKYLKYKQKYVDLKFKSGGMFLFRKKKEYKENVEEKKCGGLGNFENENEFTKAFKDCTIEEINSSSNILLEEYNKLKVL